MKYSKAELEEARRHLLTFMTPGTKVYTMLRHVSKSGMYRCISLFVIRDGEPVCIDYWASRLLEGYDDRHRGCRASGCGMDMGFHLVHNLGYTLYPDGYDCTGRADDYSHYCPSNDHSNGDRDYSPHHHSSGGYAFRHTWM